MSFVIFGLTKMQPDLYLPILNNFKDLYKSKKNYDVIIQAEDEEIRAHSIVLCCQSNYFYTALSDTWARRRDEKYIFKMPNISSRVLEIIIRY